MELVREIVSRTGTVHFRRWAIFRCKWFRLYLHQILEADKDLHLHTHPWHFCSLVLSGGYIELVRAEGERIRKPGSFVCRHKDTPHKIHRVLGPTKTLVIAVGRHDDSWGYIGDEGERIQHAIYREMKRAGKFN